MTRKVLLLLAGLAALGGCASNGQNATTGGATGTGGAVAGTLAPGSEQDFVNSVGDRVFFAYDQSSLSDDARATLDRQSAWLQRYPAVTIQIAGNCDERGTQEYNLALGSRRANAARDYLVSRGISSARISTISYGKERPVALGSDEQAYAQNRNAITAIQ